MSLTNQTYFQQYFQPLVKFWALSVKMADFQRKVFLGGSCGASTWRDEVIYRLCLEDVPFFNPQKGDGEWQMDDLEIEEQEKKASNVLSSKLSTVQWRVLCATKNFEDLIIAALQGSALCDRG